MSPALEPPGEQSSGSTSKGNKAKNWLGENLEKKEEGGQEPPADYVEICLKLPRRQLFLWLYSLVYFLFW